MMRFALSVGLLLAGVNSAQAHQSSDAYLSWQVDGSRIHQRIDIALRDLDRDLQLDADDDGILVWREVRTRWPDIERLATQGVRVTSDGHPCVAQAPSAPQLDEHSDGHYAVMQLELQCGSAVRVLEIDYRLFERSDATHRGIARINGSSDGSVVLVPAAGVQRFVVDPARPGLRTFAEFVTEGIRHIAGGLDHILFLVTLLMVAVWRRSDTGWVPRHSTASAWTETLRLVTAFTVAHSITLALATHGLLAPPSHWVESLIAISVLVAALDNLWPFMPGPRWAMASAFGLVHGLGFAGPLQDLGLREGELMLPLLGFNLGVELGQLALVGLLLPLAISLRRTRWYRLGLVRGGSLGVAGLALVWTLERTLELNILH